MPVEERRRSMQPGKNAGESQCAARLSDAAQPDLITLVYYVDLEMQNKQASAGNFLSLLLKKKKTRKVSGILCTNLNPQLGA